MFDEEPGRDPHEQCRFEIDQLRARIAELEAEVARANDGIGYWTNQSADLVSQIELVNLENSALRDGIVDANERIETMRERQRVLTKAIENIAIQKLEDEMDEEDREGADYQEGYECIVKVARAALAAKEG